MNNITIIIRFNGEKQSVPTQSNVILEDLLNQLANRGVLPQNENWVVTKMNGDTALDLGRSLEANHIVDNDVLLLALPTKAG